MKVGKVTERENTCPVFPLSRFPRSPVIFVTPHTKRYGTIPRVPYVTTTPFQSELE